MSIKVFNSSTDFNKEMRSIATEKQARQSVVEVKILAPFNHTTKVITHNRTEGHWSEYLSNWCFSQKEYDNLRWVELDRSIHIKNPEYFERHWDQVHNGKWPPPSEVEYSDFEKQMQKYFKENNLKIAKFSSVDERHYFVNWIEDFCTDKDTGEVRPRANLYALNAEDYPFSYDADYFRVDEAIMINFFNYISKNEDIIACQYDSKEGKYRIHFESSPDDWKKARDKLYNYAKDFKLIEHFKNTLFKDEDVMWEGLETKSVSIAPSKTLEEKAEQNSLKDKNGITIETGDVIAYPRGGDHNYYCLCYGKVKGNTKEFVVMEDDQKARCDKVMVIKTSNKNKKLPWE